jgi:hypothetical protein
MSSQTEYRSQDGQTQQAMQARPVPGDRVLSASIYDVRVMHRYHRTLQRSQ